MSEWRVLSSRDVRVMSLSVPQPTAEQRPLAALLVPAGFFCWKVIFFSRSPVPDSFFPFESIWENKRRQVAYLVCLWNPSSHLMGFSFLHFFLIFFICPYLQHTSWLSLCSHPAFKGSAVVSGCLEAPGMAWRQSTVHSVTNLVLYCTYR